MTFKSGRIFYFIIIISTFLWNQQTSFFTQKIALENSYRNKVISAVSRLLGQDKYIVIVNVDFSTANSPLKKTSSLQSSQRSENGYTPIPGLPTVPSYTGRSSRNTKEDYNNLSIDNFSISRVEVNIGLNEELTTELIKQEIESLIEKAIPETRDCEDCIKIESFGFLPTEKSKEIEELKKEISDLKFLQKQAEEGILNKKLEDTEERLKEAKKDREESENQIKSWEDELERRDALAHARLVEFERSRHIQDSIRHANTENELRSVRDSKMRSDSTLLSKTMGIVEKQINSKDVKEESLLGMDVGNNWSGMMGSVIFILLIICLMVVTFLAARNKKPKTIYLKQKAKKQKTKKKMTEDSSEINGENVDANTSAAPTTPPTPILKHDEDAIRSELRSLQQTAVSLTVGEKESASALIKEWLEDNPNKDENTEDE